MVRWPHRLVLTTTLTALAVGLGCTPGTFEAADDDDTGGGADAGADATPPVDAAPPQGLSGSVMDFGGVDLMPGATLSTVGLNPEIGVTADGTGAYVMLPPDGASFAVIARNLPGYRPTTNAALTMPTPTGVVVQNLYMVSEVYASRQVATMGLPIIPNTAIIIADLVDAAGLPKEGIPLADITLVNAVGTPIGDGPYFIGPLGDVDANVLTSTAVNGHARVAFLNVPPGNGFVITAVYPPPPGGVQGTPVSAVCNAAPAGANLPLLKH